MSPCLRAIIILASVRSLIHSTPTASAAVFTRRIGEELAGWAAAATAGSGCSELKVADGLVVRFVKLEQGWHLANLKPTFMLRVLEEFEPDATSVFYFDPDIVIKCRWSFFEEWIEAGVAMVCEMYMSPMPETHPFRYQWMQALGQVGFIQKRSVDFYVNSGFVGAKRSQAAFVGQWKAVMEGAEKLGRDMSQYKTGEQTGSLQQLRSGLAQLRRDDQRRTDRKRHRAGRNGLKTRRSV